MDQSLAYCNDTPLKAVSVGSTPGRDRVIKALLNFFRVNTCADTLAALSQIGRTALTQVSPVNGDPKMKLTQGRYTR